MESEFRLPELGENIESASVVKVLVAVGQAIQKDQPVLELETDKATIEVPSTLSGIVKEIKVQEGGKAEVGQVVMTIDADGAAAEAKEEAPAKSKKPPAEKKKAQAKEKSPAESKKPEKTKPEAAPAPKRQEAPAATTGTVEFKIPELGENITEASVVNVLVKSGDTIEKDQSLLELETDKATIEVPSEVAGKIKDVRVNAGDKVKVGQSVFVIETSASAPAVERTKEPVEAKDTPQQTGDETAVPVEDAEAEAKTIKQTKAREDTARAASVPEGYRRYRPDSILKIAPAAPSVRRFAREIGIDINVVPGSGIRGRISIDDVKTFARLANSRASKAPAVSGVATPPLPDFSKWGQVERKAMTNVRLKTAQNMTIAWQSVARVTQYDKADITELEEHRKRFGSKVEVAGGKLTVTAIMLKVVASALKAFPQFNASIDMAKNEIIYKKYYHIGVAVDTDRGLLVPVVRDVDKKNILQLSVDLTELAEKARNKKLSLDEMQGGSFTITNLGGIGGTAFSPIVYYPEVAILGISRGSIEPVYIDGKFEPRLMLPISLSYDHRIIDGADAARFLRWIAEALKDPFLLALEG